MSRLPLSLLALPFLLACPGDTPGDTGDTADTGTELVEIAVALTVWPENEPVAGADVCWRMADDAVCGVTAADGTLLLEVPARTTGEITFDSPVLYPTAMPIVLGRNDLTVNVGLDGAELVEALHAEAGVALDPTRAMIGMQVHGAEGPAGGAELWISPESGQGPFYLDGTGQHFDLDATSTVEGMGAGAFYGVDPAAGPFSVGATPSGGEPCDNPMFGVAPPVFEVRPGVGYFVLLTCR